MVMCVSVTVTERTLDEAVNSVTLADDTAYIRVQEGFSEALSRRLVALATLSNDSLLATDLNVGQLKVTMDATNMQGGHSIMGSPIRGSSHYGEVQL